MTRLNYKDTAVQKPKGIVPYCTKPPAGVSLADYRFLRFLAFVHLPITEDKVIKFYKDNVMRFCQKFDIKWTKNGSKYFLRGYKPEETRQLALNWFDRSLGRTLRKGILTQIAKNKLTTINQ